MLPVGSSALLRAQPAGSAEPAQPQAGGLMPVAPLSGAAALLRPGAAAALRAAGKPASSGASPDPLAAEASADIAELLKDSAGTESPASPTGGEADQAALSPGAKPSAADAAEEAVKEAMRQAKEAFGKEAAAEAVKEAQEARKRHVFIASPPGVGKTTMVRKLLERLQRDEGKEGLEWAGFYTEEVRDTAGQRAGFDILRIGIPGPSGAPSRLTLARLGQALPRVGKYSVDLDSFEAHVLPTIAPPPPLEPMPPPPLPPLPENPRLYIHPSTGVVEAVSLLGNVSDGTEGGEEAWHQTWYVEGVNNVLDGEYQLSDIATTPLNGEKPIYRKTGEPPSFLFFVAKTQTWFIGSDHTQSTGWVKGAGAELVQITEWQTVDGLSWQVDDRITVVCAKAAGDTTAGPPTQEEAETGPEASPEGSPAAESQSEPAKPQRVNIYIPSLDKEQEVDVGALEPVPDGWRPPDDLPPIEEDSEEEGPPRVCLCDEVGKMGLLSLRFPPTLYAALDSKTTVLGTLPQAARGQRDAEAVEIVKRRPDVRVFKLTRNNRDSMVDHAYAALREGLALGDTPGQAAKDRVVRNAERAERNADRKRRRAEVEAVAAKKQAVLKRRAETPEDRENALKIARKAAKDRERAESKKQRAAKEASKAKDAREQRKKRLASRQEVQDLARKGKAVEVGVEDSDEDLEMESDVDMGTPCQALDSDDEGVEATVVVANVPAKARRLPIPSPSPLPSPLPSPPGSSAAPSAAAARRLSRSKSSQSQLAGAPSVVLLED